MKIAKTFLGLLFVLIFTASLALSQNANSGEIKGAVVDANGAAIEDVTITIVSVLTGVTTTLKTNSSGLYDAPFVPTGEYTITFAKTGFRDLVRKGIVLQVDTITVDSTLEVGIPTEQVVVTADASLLETETSNQRVTFNTKAVIDAPIVGGVWYNQLTAVLPGVAGGAGSSGEGVAVNGTRSFDANWLMEGVSVTNPRDNNPSNFYPPVDAISEVSVNTINSSAQFGNGVATFSVGIRSGNNGWHGSLFEFIQNDAFDSLNFFNTSGLNAPKRWNEYGGSVGGPILKNKLFFFFNYQRNKNTTSALHFATVPTQAMRNGDFSESSSPTLRVLPNQIDPVAAAIQNLFPLPNRPGLANNFEHVVSTPTTSTWYVAKIDYQLNQNQRFSGSLLSYPISLTFDANAFCDLGFGCTRTAPANLNTTAQVTHTWTINPTILNEFRVGYMREHDGYAPATFGKGFPEKIGLQPRYGTNAPADIFPNITVNAGGGIGQIGLGGGVHADLAMGRFNASDVVTLVRGKHSIKIGGEFDKSYQNYTNWGDVSSGNFFFSSIQTGIPYADFLLGNVQGWFVFNNEATSAHTSDLGAFLQDDFKVTQRLTLNLGLRYQRQGGWRVDDNKFGVFDPTLPNPGPFIPPNTLGALLYGGQNGRDQIQNAVNEFAPRVGLAWSPWEKWSIRASYGIFNSPRDGEAYTDGVLALGLNPQGSRGFSNTVAFSLKDGPPPGSVVFPTLETLSPALLNFNAVHYYAPDLPIQYAQMFYLDVQREMPGNLLLEAAYVFTKGTNLNFSRDINRADDRPRAFVQYSSIKDHRFDGYSNYNALQLRALRRFSQGLSFQVNYSWSKLLDTGTGSGHSDNVDVWQNAFDVRANYGPSTLDAPHNFTGYVSYELPFGKGQRFSSASGLVNHAIGGWRIGSLFQARSGIPFTPTFGGNDPCFCGYSQFPDRVGSGQLSNPTIERWFDATAFRRPTGAFGNSGRNILRGPKYVNFDMNLARVFHIRDDMRLELRADAFNVFNHPNFGLPNSDLNSPEAGRITSTTTFGAADRVLQLGIRFNF